MDRLWPRGLGKNEGAVAPWFRELAPSTPLRRGFGHDPARWNDFRLRYFAGLDTHPEPVDTLFRKIGDGNVTLLYAATDDRFNNAMALRDYLMEKTANPSPRS